MVKLPDNIEKVLHDYIGKLSKEIHIVSAILFGSYARGNWRNDSDVDIAVFSDSFSNMDRIQAIAFLLDKSLQYGIDIQPLAFDEKDFRNDNENPFITEIMTTGIKIA